MRTKASVLIECPIDEVFDLTSNHVVEWSSIVVEDEAIHETPEKVGSTFRTVTEDRGNRMVFDGVITQYDAPHALCITMNGQMFDIHADYSFDEVDGMTQVTQDCEVRGKGLLKIMFALTGWAMRKKSCRELEKELNHLKDFCEHYVKDPAAT